MSELIDKAAEAIRSADALLFTAGAGMGVDSGLPDFRGNDGFWNAYPPYRHLGLSFSQLANPEWFYRDPHLAWGFYGHRLNLYRATLPHAGFAILKKWANDMPGGARIFTSNVDGHFQKAGFAEEFLTEVHGSIHHLQCTRHCGDIWSAAGVNVRVDPETFRATGDLPRCPCGALARPNILMFGDGGWLSTRTMQQEDAFEQWRAGVRNKSLVVIECGAGTAIPTIRYISESMVAKKRGILIRINIREPHVPAGHLGIPLGALAALSAIDALL